MSCRLYIDPDRLREGYVNLSGADYHYLFRVRRLKVGQAVELFDGVGHRADSVVHKVDKKRGTLIAETPTFVERDQSCSLEMIVSLVKGERLGWVVAKLVELGVDTITPVWSERTAHRPKPPEQDKLLARLTTVSREAARQCRTAYVPVISPPRPVLDRFGEGPANATKLLLYEGESVVRLRDAIADGASSIVAAIGPEGGFSPAEVEAATAAGFVPVTLGARILRAETAAVATATVLRYASGDLG